MKSANDLSEQNDSKQKLIEAGIELFSSKGFHAVSVREICERAQVNVSLISYYFTGKDGLLNAVLEEMTKKGAQKIEHLIEKFDSKQDFERRLKAFLSEMIQFYLDNSALMRLFLEELEKEQPEAEKVFSATLFKTFDIFKSFLGDAAKAGFLRTKTHDEQILMIQVLAPFMDLMKTENCAIKFYKTSLSSKTFRQDLIDQVTYSLMV